MKARALKIPAVRRTAGRGLAGILAAFLLPAFCINTARYTIVACLNPVFKAPQDFL